MCLLHGPLSGGPGQGKPVSCSERDNTTVITKVPRYIIRSNIVSGIKQKEVQYVGFESWSKVFVVLFHHLIVKRVNSNKKHFKFFIYVHPAKRTVYEIFKKRLIGLPIQGQVYTSEFSIVFLPNKKEEVTFNLL